MNEGKFEEAKNALSSALEGFTGQWGEFTRELRGLRRVCARCLPQKKGGALSPREVMGALNEVLAPDDIVTTGVGQHQMFAAHFLVRRQPRTFVTSGGAGTMGFGLPAGIGAALARPSSRVWVVDGDGSIQMTVQELATVAETGARVIILVLENHFLGMVRQWQEIFHQKRYSAVALKHNPDFVKLAEAYGIKGVKVTDLEQLRRALRQACQSDRSQLIQVVVEEESNILPMTPPGKGLQHFFGNCIREPGQFFTTEETALAMREEEP